MNQYNVVEIFSSINGEGPRAGQLALFIRFKGCNLNCSYCDTKWANEPNCRCYIRSDEDILDTIRMMHIKNITITGGEPLLQEHMAELLQLIVTNTDSRVEIETNGSIDLTPYRELGPNITFTMDYKLPGSGMEEHMRLENFELLRADDTVKFVSGGYDDLCKALELIRTYDLTNRCHVYVSPVFGKIDPEEIVNFMKANHLNDVNLQLQMHKIIWDSEMRGV